MAEPIKKAVVSKPARKVVGKAAASVAVAPAAAAVKHVVEVAKPVVKAKRPIVRAKKPVVEAAKPVAEANKPVVEASKQMIAQITDTVEAVASPAIESDIVPEVAAPSPVVERIVDMANFTTPAEGFEKGQAMLGDVTARFKTAFDKSSKMGEDMVDFAKGNVEAVVASARIAAKAGESFGQDAADYSKKQFESATALFKSFANVKSPTDLFQLQSEFAKASFDSAIAEASRVSESMMKVAGEIAQPLSSRYAIAADKMKVNTL